MFTALDFLGYLLPTSLDPDVVGMAMNDNV